MIICVLKGILEFIFGFMYGVRRELMIDFICFFCVLIFLGFVDRKFLFFIIFDVKNNILEYVCVIINLNK